MILTVCDNTVYVKKLKEVENIMKDCDCGFPYAGAKECYILDVEDGKILKKLIPVLYDATPQPKKKNPKVQSKGETT